MNSHKQHLETEEKIDRYINNELSQEQIDDLWADMILEDGAIDYLKNASNLKALAEQKKNKQKHTRRVWMYAAAAVVLLLVIVLASVQSGVFDRKLNVQPVKTIELDYSRSAAPLPAKGKKKIIHQAIILFNQGKIEQAVSFLSDHRDKAEDLDWITELDMTIGTIYYDTDKFNKAAYYFSDIISHKGKIKKLKLEKAYWYLGNSYFQMDLLEEAHKAMEKAYHLNGAYSRVAKKYLDALADVKDKREHAS